MCRLNIIVTLVVVLLMPYYIFVNTSDIPAINSDELFNNPEESEEFFDPINQEIHSSYQDYLNLNDEQQPPNESILYEPPSSSSSSVLHINKQYDNESSSELEQSTTVVNLEHINYDNNNNNNYYYNNNNNNNNNYNNTNIESQNDEHQKWQQQESADDKNPIDLLNIKQGKMITHNLNTFLPTISKTTSRNEEDPIQTNFLIQRNETDDDLSSMENFDDSEENQTIINNDEIIPMSITTHVPYSPVTTTTTTLRTTTRTTTTTSMPSITTTLTTSDNVPPTTIKIHRKTFKTKPPIFKLNADEILRKFVEDSYIRSPLAILIDTSSESLRKAKILWKAALRPNAPLDIVLVAYNLTGVGVTYSFKNTRTMMAGLDSVQNTPNSIDYENGGGSAFYGIMRASELIPYDSAIFISTDRIPSDINLAQYAAIALLKKRIRLYLIWFGPKSTDFNEAIGQNSEGGILGEVALRSGGEILHVSDETLRPNGDFGLITFLLRNDIQGAQEFPIPIDTTVKNLQIKYQGNIDSATLETPNGEIDLMNSNLLYKDLPGYLIKVLPSNNDDNNKCAVFIDVLATHNGVFILKLIPIDVDEFYSVSIKINYTNDSNYKKNDNYNEVKYSISNNLNEPKSERLISNVNDNIEMATDGDIFPKNSVIFPEDYDGIELSDLNITEMAAKNERNTLQFITKIDIGLQSQLLANPGSTVQIYFEITNLREEATFHNFQVVDEQRFLRSLSQPSALLQPSQVVTIIVTAYIPPNIEIGTKDKITLTSQGFGTSASQSATLTVIGATSVQDTRVPSLWWGFGSRCDGRTGAGQCASSVWSLEISVQDTDTGILRVQSNPKGIYIRSPFTAGTTSEVKATYTSSCCTTRVTITCYDLAGNQRSATVDVTEFILNEASIAAIALGCILLLLIIIIAIVLIVWCCRKRKASRELPVYRTRRDRDERAT